LQKQIKCPAKNINCGEVQQRNDIGFIINTNKGHLNKYQWENGYKKWKQDFFLACRYDPPVKEWSQQSRISKAKWQSHRVEEKIQNCKKKILVESHVTIKYE
jgi:hypothetical protein